MKDDQELSSQQPTSHSRRDLLRGAGLVSIAAAGSAAAADTAEAAQAAMPTGAARREALETLTALEAQTLEAVADRILPSDENGPGAKEARAIHYIDRSLASDHADNRDEYGIGLTLLNEHAVESDGAPFHELRPGLQDAILTELEAGHLEGFSPSSEGFFGMLRDHVIEGTFSDPYYGGNHSFIGWDMIKYPGVRLGVTAEDVAQGAALEPTHRSAYDHPTFTKTSNGDR